MRHCWLSLLVLCVVMVMGEEWGSLELKRGIMGGSGRKGVFMILIFSG